MASPSLQAKRTVIRGLSAAGSRLLQGSLLVIAIWWLPAQEQSVLAIGIAAVTAINLTSNLGIPTLFVKYALGGDRAERRTIPRLLRAYLYLSAAATVAVFGLATALGGGLPVAVALGALCLCVSLFSGVEYVCLAFDRFEDYLRWGIPVQLVAGLCSPIILALTHSVSASLVALAGSYAMATAMMVGRGVLASAWECGEPGPTARWLRGAAAISLGTFGAALLYAIDVVMLGGMGYEGTNAQYRLAISIVGVAVGVLPVAPFILVDSSRGLRISGRRIAPFAGSAMALAILGAGVLYGARSIVGDSWWLLLCLAPLAALRLVSQSATSILHAAGRHPKVARGYLLAAVAWGGVGLAVLHSGWSLVIFASTQIVVEGALAMWLWGAARAGAPSAMPSLALA